VEIVFPEASEVESMIAAHGPNLFYREVSLRQLCCHIRKVRPLERKLATLRAWVVGLRRSQMQSRADIAKIETRDGIEKISPLADWSRQDVEDYIRRHDVPVHPLYAKGFPSIGCGPCTRAVFDCEDERAGRWWWEQDTEKECGIHITPSGQIIRLSEEVRGQSRRQTPQNSIPAEATPFRILTSVS